MARKVKVLCKLCGDEVMPRSCGGPGRAAHLKEKHPEAEGGIYANFDYKEIPNYSDLIVKQQKKVKAKQLRASKKSSVIPEVKAEAA